MDQGQILKVEGISSGYGKLKVLHKVDIHVNEGEIVCLLGANGAGKTTLLRTISGLIRPEEGRIMFMGTPITGLRADRIAKLGISHVPEGRQIFVDLTVKQNLLLGTYRRKLKREELTTAFDYCLELFPVLKKKMNQKGGTLSGGEQQMLAIARGLMSRPRLLLLDEPSLGLAPLVVERIMEVVSGLRDKGISILMVEQNVNTSLSVADRAYILRTGRIVLEGTGKDLLTNEDIKRSYLGV